MLIKIISRIQNVCIPSKISIIISTLISVFLFAIAILLSTSDVSIEIKYLYENMARVATNIFALGIFLGLVGEYLAQVIDRSGK